MAAATRNPTVMAYSPLAKVCYWDSCIFLRLIDRNTNDIELLNGIDKIKKLVDDDEVVLCTFVLVHIEASMTRIRNSASKLGKFRRLLIVRM